jgi:hypothetical protein
MPWRVVDGDESTPAEVADHVEMSDWLIGEIERRIDHESF